MDWVVIGLVLLFVFFCLLGVAVIKIDERLERLEEQHGALSDYCFKKKEE